VANDHEIAFLCKELDVDYGAALERWRDKYVPTNEA